MSDAARDPQITVRLPEELVAFLDDEVTCGAGRSRSAVVSRPVERERRRKIAEHDAAVPAGLRTEDDLDQLARFAADTRMLDID